MWFEKLTGFKEVDANFIKANLEIDGEMFVSKVNNKKFYFGQLEIPTLNELRERDLQKATRGEISVKQIVANVQELHEDIENENAIFQAASQFNLLEMVGPEITPELGVDRYENDYTQGPACAISCGAGTIYRNYFANVNNQIGQTATNQINCLDLITASLEEDSSKLLSMSNGYAIVNQEGLLGINKKLGTLNNQQREELKGKLKIGIQWNTEVTISTEKHKVSQVYCSALPVAYNNIESFYWESFALIILEATYEATLYAALINFEKTGCNLVFLTLVGGGAFGNEDFWIFEAMEKAILKFKDIPLDIRIVSYGGSNWKLDKCIDKVIALIQEG